MNGYTEGDDGQPPTLHIDPAVERAPARARLAAVKQARDDDAVRALARAVRTEAADPTVNLMPALIEAAARHATVGESMGPSRTSSGPGSSSSFV